ncbi:MAG: TVP38/TMEM64 family protein [Phycisphaerae bacterium]|nr:TVP38/TMEM64 family protein [Phycisphaerae bacterium]
MKKPAEDIVVGKRSAKIRFVIFWLILLSTAVAIGYAMYTGFLTRESLQSWVGRSNGWAPVIYVVFASVLNATWAPRWLTTVVAGALFGLVIGALLALTAGVTGSIAAYLFGRNLGHPYLATHTNTDKKRMARFLRRHGFGAVFLTRVCPLVPCEIISLVSGSLAIPAGSFILATFLGMLPGAFLYAAFGSSLINDEEAWIKWGSLAAFGVLTLITGIIMARLWRREAADYNDSSGRHP